MSILSNNLDSKLSLRANELNISGKLSAGLFGKYLKQKLALNQSKIQMEFNQMQNVVLEKEANIKSKFDISKIQVKKKFLVVFFINKI